MSTTPQQVLNMQLHVSSILVTFVSLLNAFSFHPRTWAHSAPPCPAISPGPATLNQLAELPLLPRPDYQAETSIRQLLALYAFAVDGRNFEAFDRILTDDVRTNYSGPLGEIVGLKNVRTSIETSLKRFAATQHSLGTQYIASCGRDSAISITYYRASHFFEACAPGVIRNGSAVLYATARYEDTWRKQKGGNWKIVNRNNVFTGPLIADL